VTIWQSLTIAEGMKNGEGGLDQALFCKLAKALYLRLNSGTSKDYARLIDVLFLHDFLPSRDAF
jgi:hypothetical protein